ncbi:MAG: VWA domain-containing protein [Methyloversatilis sp.]|jgi:mxaL protein|nr:VWA domain-containing protein [Methyloversatilis sp.]MBP6195014.1 VWA domain-containing protein [Methyloversatilis sp.]
MIAPLRTLVARARSAHALPLTLATALFAVAAVLPPLPVPGRSYHHMVVLDITQSMNTRDYELNGNPASRLDYAKHSLAISLRGLPCGSSVGWGVFAEYRLLTLMTPVEVCGNYHELLATLANIDGQMSWAGASEVSKGLFSSIRILKDMEQAPSLVFVTDGHEAPPLNPKMRPSFDGEPGAVKGLIVGTGGETLVPIPKFDPDGAPLGFWRPDEVVQGNSSSRGRGGSAETMVDESGKPIEQTTASGTEHLSNLKASHLRDLASQTGMVYEALASPDELGKALNNPAFARSGSVPTQLGWIPALIGLLCLVWTYRPDSWRTGNRV